MKERVYRYRLLERELLAGRPGARVLDVGCGVGDNLARLRRYGVRPVGVDPALARLRRGARVAPAAAARGEALPWRDACFDAVYVSHVLHHVPAPAALLAEAHRVLVPGGLLLLVETVEDSPLLRLARRLRPQWQGDPVESRFRFEELCGMVAAGGFRPEAGRAFNWLYFAWELLPLALPPLERLSGLFVALESGLDRVFGRYGAHAWLLARRPGPPRFPLAPDTPSRLP